MKQDELVKTPLRYRLPDISNYTIVILIAALFIALSLSTETFLSYNNIYSILFGVSIQFFALIGFTFLIIMGEIDLSVGSAYGFAGALLGIFVSVFGIPFFPAFLLAVVTMALIGFLNGFLVVRFRVMSMIITIGMMSVLRGGTSILTTVLGAQVFPSAYRKLIKFRIGDIHWSVIAFILLVIVLEILLYKSSIFRQLFYIGHNQNTARIYGIKTNRIKTLIFSVSAATAGIGGILATSRITHAYPTTGLNLEFTMVTAAVIGGASLNGGRGSILRSALGLLLLSMVQNGMIIFGIDPYYQQVLLGVILILAVFVDARLNASKV